MLMEGNTRMRTREEIEKEDYNEQIKVYKDATDLNED